MLNYLKISPLVLLFLLSSCASDDSDDGVSFCDCADSPTSFIIGLDTHFLPNVISPNADGINDSWSSTLFSGSHSAHVVLTDSDGDVVLNSSDVSVINEFGSGLEQEEGNDKFSYVLTIDDVHVFNGSVCSYNGYDKGHEFFECILMTTPFNEYDPVFDPEYEPEEVD